MYKFGDFPQFGDFRSTTCPLYENLDLKIPNKYEIKGYSRATQADAKKRQQIESFKSKII